MRWMLYLGSLVVGSALMYAYLNYVKPLAEHPHLSTQKPDPVLDTVPALPASAANGFPAAQFAENYIVPEGQSPEMQAFEKGARFLAKLQETDGHWSAKNTGAAPEFQNTNGDIAITALSTYTLLLTARGKQSNPAIMQRAMLGMQWLLARIQPNGQIAKMDEPGEPAIAQALACLTLMQASTMSTKDELKKKGIQAVRYTVLEMANENGGWGITAKAKELRADANTLGVFVYRAARLEELRFSDNPDRTANVKLEVEIENKIKESLKRLMLKVPPETPPGQAPKTDVAYGPDDGVYAMSSDNKTADWDATVGGLLAQIQMLTPPSKTVPTVKYIFGEFDKTTSRFPAIQKKMGWGTNGENVRGLSMWFNTVSTMYLFGEQTFEHKTWNEICKEIVLKKQRKDGGWDIAGEDAKRGQAWRAALFSLTATLIAPPPPPPQPEDPVAPTK